MSRIEKDFDKINKLSESLNKFPLNKIPLSSQPKKEPSPCKENESIVTTSQVVGKFILTFSELEDAILNLKKLTQAPDISMALELAWHKIDMQDKDSLRRQSMLVSLCRIWQDGNLVPPINLYDLYRGIDKGVGIREILAITTTPSPSPKP